MQLALFASRRARLVEGVFERGASGERARRRACEPMRFKRTSAEQTPLSQLLSVSGYGADTVRQRQRQVEDELPSRCDLRRSMVAALHGGCSTRLRPLLFSRRG